MKLNTFFGAVEKTAKTQTVIRLASHLVRAPDSRSGGAQRNSICLTLTPSLTDDLNWMWVWIPSAAELGELTKKRKVPWGQVFLQCLVTPTWSHDHVSLSGCVTLAACTSLADSIARQTYLPATADSTSVLNQAHVQHLSGTRVSTVQKPAETQTSIWLASYLVRAANSRYGGHEFESPLRQNSVNWLKSGNILGVKSFYRALLQSSDENGSVGTQCF